MATQRRKLTAPLWLGEGDVAGKTILLHAEQGFGDTIQFVRYAPLLAARGARVVLEVQPQLVRLLSGMAGVAQVCRAGAVAAIRFALSAAQPAARVRHRARQHPGGRSLCRAGRGGR